MHLFCSNLKFVQPLTFLISTAGFQIFQNFFTFNRWFKDFSATFCLQPFSDFSATFLLSTDGLKIFLQIFVQQLFNFQPLI